MHRDRGELRQDVEVKGERATKGDDGVERHRYDVCFKLLEPFGADVLCQTGLSGKHCGNLVDAEAVRGAAVL